MIKPMLEDVVAQQPMLDEIVIEELDLGPHPMRLAGLKVYDTKDDEVIMEAPVQWGSSVKVRATLTWRRAQRQGFWLRGQLPFGAGMRCVRWLHRCQKPLLQLSHSCRRTAAFGNANSMMRADSACAHCARL